MADNSRLFQIVENTEATSPRPTSEAAPPAPRESRLQRQKNSRASGCTIWLSSCAADQRNGEADHCSWARTGGVLIGYWCDTSTAVITDAIGSGPAGRREWQAWLLKQLAWRYEVSGRRETCLGGWHTRPDDGVDGLSPFDQRELQRIIETAAVWTPDPLMVVFHGTKADSPATAWLAALSPHSALQAELKLLGKPQEMSLAM